MVFCAGDNELSPLIVSQLKDLKDAGHNDEVNVLVYFDANERGVPTRLYSINQNGQNGDSGPWHTYVSNLASDDVTIDPTMGPAAKRLSKALKDPLEKKADEALAIFLAFCREQYSAEHYALVLVGHGMIVANDAFLPAEFPDSSITLKELGENIDGFGESLALLALHSCSMSAVEVAYEVKGKAKYMIASEGPAFVQGWPYRKLLKKLFEFLNETNSHNGHSGQNGNVQPQAEHLDVRHLIEGLYSLSSSNGLDFMLSGYSQDLALINLDPDNFPPLTAAIEELVVQLKQALKDETGVPKQLIQLAHLESQSYYNESYTDLYDFCLCLERSCKTEDLQGLKTACEKVRAERSDDGNCDEARELTTQARELSERVNYIAGKAEALLTASVCQNADDPLQAISTAKESLALWGSVNDRLGMARAYQTIGHYELAQTNLAEATKNHEESLKIFHELNIVAEQAEALINFGFVAYRQGRWDDCLSLLTRAQRMVDEEAEPFKMGQIISTIGETFLENGLPEAALKKIELAKDYFHKAQKPKSVKHHALGSRKGLSRAEKIFGGFRQFTSGAHTPSGDR